jgi:hypothetical protein
VKIESCIVSAETGAYTVSWSADPSFPTTAFHVFENGVRVATVDGQTTTYVAPLPVTGKTFVQIAAELEGHVSGLRDTCQFQNTSRAPFPRRRAKRRGAHHHSRVQPRRRRGHEDAGQRRRVPGLRDRRGDERRRRLRTTR